MMKGASKTTLKSIVKTKALTNVNVKPAASAMVELIFLLFLKRLAEEARTKALEEKSSVIKAHHVRLVAKEMLKKARG